MTVTWPRPNRMPGFVDALGVAGLMGLLVARFVPIAKWIPFWGCALRERTGIPCPGCGLTRAADHFSHGRLGMAWDANPLGTVAAAAFAACVVVSFAHLAFKAPVPEIALSRREMSVVRVAVVALVAVNYTYLLVRALG